MRFAFVSCQSVNEGKQNAWRRMVWEDVHAPAERQLNFVLHLGDFIYEVVEYPEEIAHRYDRTVYDIGRIPDGRKVVAMRDLLGILDDLVDEIAEVQHEIELPLGGRVHVFPRRPSAARRSACPR